MSADSTSDVPTRPAEDPGRPIVVGTDGSAEADRGVRLAADLATRFDVELVVVHALGLTSQGHDWHETPDERRRWATEQLADAWTSSVDRSRVRVDTTVVDGPSALVLLRVADERDAEFIVVGSHGVGASSDPFLGRTSSQIVADSHRPVIVVPPPDDHVHRRPST